MVRVYGKWTYSIICAVCRQDLTHNEYAYSGGVCPHCGHAVKGTFCDAVKVIVRGVYEWRYFFGFIPYKKRVDTEHK